MPGRARTLRTPRRALRLNRIHARIRPAAHAGPRRSRGEGVGGKSRREALRRGARTRNRRAAGAAAARAGARCAARDRGAQGRACHHLRRECGGLGLGPARRRRLRRLAPGERARAPWRGGNAQGLGVADLGVSRSLDQAFAGRGAAARRPAGDCTHRRVAWRSRQWAAMCRPRTSRPSTSTKRISSPSPSDSSAFRICGAARRRSGSTARVWCRSRSLPAALPVRATATCRNRRWGPALSVNLDGAAPRRGDLVFWSGHVAIVRDRSSLLHANAFHMSVAIEPIAEAVSRIRDSGSEISSVRRIETPID